MSAELDALHAAEAALKVAEAAVAAGHSTAPLSFLKPTPVAAIEPAAPTEVAKSTEIHLGPTDVRKT